MKPTDNIERVMQSVRLSTTRTLDDRILNDSTEALARAAHEPPAAGRILRIGRFLMQNQYARFAAAAIVIAAVGFGLASLTVLDNGVGKAYAIEQTVQALHSVRSLHLKSEGRMFGGNPGEFWVEFDPAGQLLRCRMEWPQSEDGHKVVFYRDGKADVWLKTKNAFVTYGLGHQLVTNMRQMAMACDPKLTVGRLQQEQAAGLAQIEQKLPTTAGEPIVLTVTYQPTSGRPDRREIVAIDPVTKLVRWIDKQQVVDGQYQSLGRIDILEYNQPIDPAVYQPQLPDDVMRIDQTSQLIGLPKGQMSDEEIAKEVARQFFQALIDKDYAKAGQLFGGMPARKIEEVFGKFPVVRIVSVGETAPDSRTGSLRVSCQIEVEKDGVRQTVPVNPRVRPVESQRDRWNISGGI